MLSLPSLAPQDSYSLWYTSSTTPNPSPFPEQNNNPHDHLHGPHSQSPSSRRHLPPQRTPLSRLRHDEEYMERRKANIQNYGSGWIKPPGVSKSLYQQREEKREMEEHQEALRREALAQELAEAEANEGVDELLQGEGGDGEMEEAVDLDDEVPDADATRFLESSDESESGDDENEVEDVPRNVLASRLPEDVFREALVRGQEARVSRPGGDDASEGDEEEGAGDMLQEEDLVHEHRQGQQDMDMDMDADLDADIPEASADGYEHTDTEEELSSSEEDSGDESQLPQRVPASASMVRSDGTQNSMDLSHLMSGSSQIGSSPRQVRGYQNRRSGRSS